MATRKTIAAKTAPKTVATKPVAAKKPALKRAEAPVAVAAAPVAKPKPKLVRDSFTIPKTEYSALGDLKLRAIKLARPAKKSEILRAGIAVLSTLTDKAFLAALQSVPSLKTGRPEGAKPAAGSAG